MVLMYTFESIKTRITIRRMFYAILPKTLFGEHTGINYFHKRLIEPLIKVFFLERLINIYDPATLPMQIFNSF